MTLPDPSKKDRQFHSARDFETSASQIGEVDPFEDDIKTKAQRIIAGNAKGRTKKAKVEDAETLMRMLGVHPEDVWDASLMDAPLPRPQNNTGRSK